MGRYLGQDNTYGMFTKQILPVNGEQRSFALSHKAPTAASLLVVNNGAVLMPDVEGGYTLDKGGTYIVFDDAPVGVVHILYLGRELTVPVAQNMSNFSVLHQDTGNGTDTTFTMPIAPLISTGILVLKNGSVMRYKNEGVRGDFTVSGSSVVFEAAPEMGDELDFYIFGTRTELALPDPGTINTTHLQNNTITADKLHLVYAPFSTEIVTFGGMSSSATIFESEYQDIGKIIKVRLHFSVVLSGTADNKIRFLLPQANNGSTNVSGSVNITSNSSMESGIIKWGSDTTLDIYRQFGVNYGLEEYTIELNVEYRSA